MRAIAVKAASTWSGAAADSVVLDGKGPQSGERFTYSRQGESLKFVGDFIHGGVPVRAEAHFAKIP